MAWKDEIQHVVVLMLENQSFDRLLGFVRLDDASQRIDGVTGDETMPAALEIRAGRPSRARHRARPLHHGSDAGASVRGHRVQVFGQPRVPDPPTPTMKRVRRQLCPAGGSRRQADRSEPRGGRPGGLDPPWRRSSRCSRRASSSAIAGSPRCPGPTWPNRFFVHAATSNGYIDSPTDMQALAGFLTTRFRMRTIYENLAAAGRTWAVYFGDHAQAFGIGTLHRYARDNFRRLDAFAAEVAAGTLPHYSFLEPGYMDAPEARPPTSTLRTTCWTASG